MLKFLKLLIFPFLILLLVSCGEQNSESNNQKNQLLQLNNKWVYRIGDSPTDKYNKLVWLNDSSETYNWIKINKLSELPVVGLGKSIWLRVKLPSRSFNNNSIYVDGISQICQVFVDDKMIYQYGEFNSIDDNHFKGWKRHLIQLPAEYQNKDLTFRIWSSSDYIGIISSLQLGSTSAIMEKIFLNNLDEIIFSVIALFLGIAIFALFIFFQRNSLFGGMALFLIAIGIFTLSNSQFMQTMVNAPYLFFLADIFSLCLAPIGGFIFTESIIHVAYQKYIRRIILLQLFHFLFTAVIILLFDDKYLDLSINLFFVVVIISMVTCFYIIVKTIKKGGFEIKLFLAGILVMFFFYSLEIVSYFNNGAHSSYGFSVSWSHIGALLFIICLLWIVIYRYIETNRQKDNAQKEVLESALAHEKLQSEVKLKQIESEKLLELNHIKSRFFTNISHEFRTPLTIILGHLETIVNRINEDKTKKQLNIVERNARHLLQLINEMLDLSKLDFNEMRLRASNGNIIKFIEIIIHSFESLAAKKNIDLQFSKFDDSVEIYYENEKMQKVFNNLLSNAIKFTPQNGKITVKVENFDDFIGISISDTGLGIPESDLPKIFDRFFQVDSSTTRKYEGTGIGLALVKELVELHHGEIAVTSKNDIGTTFKILLPYGKQHLDKTEIVVPLPNNDFENNPSLLISKDELEPQVTREQKLSEIGDDEEVILIVEDNSDLREYIRENINSSYKIIEAADGNEGIKMAFTAIPDLIISDVMMPKKDGYEVCSTLKSDERTSHIPIILLTAKAEIDDKLKGLENRADDYLLKPFNTKELNARIDNLLETRKTLIEKFKNDNNITIAEKIDVSNVDKQFISKINEIIEANLDNNKFGIESFVEELHMSSSNLRRKMKQLLDISPNQYIRSFRLKRAKELLNTKQGNINEIAHKTGFSDQSYFSKCFMEEFGHSPSKK